MKKTFKPKSFEELGSIGLIGALSPHEQDFGYLEDLTEDNEIRLARSKDLAIDVTMTNLVRAYKFEDQMFVGDVIAPPKPVTSKSGKIKTRGKEAINIDVSDLLSDRGKANEISFSVGQLSYYIDPRGLVTFVDDESVESEGPIQTAVEASILLKAAIALRQEIRIRNLADATTFTITPGTDWDTSTAIHKDVAAAVLQFKRGVAGTYVGLGRRPNLFLLPDHICDEVVANDQVRADVVAAAAIADGRGFLEQMTGNNLDKITKPWGLNLLSPDCMYNSANAGLTQSISPVWGDDGYMFWTDRETRSMTWAIQPEMLRPMIVRWREENPGGWWYKVIFKRTEKVITPEAVLKVVDLT